MEPVNLLLSCRPHLMMLLLIAGLSPVKGQTYYTEMQDTRILNTDDGISVSSSCHCKVICAARPDCIAVSFDSNEDDCFIHNGPQAAITTKTRSHTESWFKYVYAPPPPIFISEGKTDDYVYLEDECADEGGVPAFLLTQQEFDFAVSLVAEHGNKVWLDANDNDGDGVIEWYDGTPFDMAFISGSVTVDDEVVLLSGDGTIEMIPAELDEVYPVICRYEN